MNVFSQPDVEVIEKEEVKIEPSLDDTLGKNDDRINEEKLKKMNVTELRAFVSKELTQDASKLKKSELLKLLQQTQV